jgi:hypothetical protein
MPSDRIRGSGRASEKHLLQENIFKNNIEAAHDFSSPGLTGRPVLQCVDGSQTSEPAVSEINGSGILDTAR